MSEDTAVSKPVDPNNKKDDDTSEDDEPAWSERLGDFALAYKWWLFGFIMLLAAFLRLWQLDFRSVWYDESFSLTLASRDIPTIINGTANDYHPPLYYLLLSGWMQLFGNGIFAARFLSVLFGIAFVAAVYGLAQEMFGSRTALLASLFAALAPFQILYSQEVRHYSLQALLGTLLIWSLYRAWRRENDWQAWGLFALVGILALYNLYFSIFSLVILDLIFVITVLYWKRTTQVWQWARLGGWLVANVVISLVYLPWFFVLLQRAGSVRQNYWISLPNLLEPFRLTNVFLLNATNLTTSPSFALLGLLIGAIATVFLLYALRFRLKTGLKGQQRRSFEVAWLLEYWLGTVGLVMLISYLYAPLYLERSLIGIAAAIYILLGRVVQTARQPILWFGLLLPGLIVLIASLNSYYFSDLYTVHYQNDLAVRHIKAAYQTGDIILHSNKLSYQPFAYLQAPGQQFLAPEEPGNSHDDLSPQTLQALHMTYTPLETVLANATGRIWFVRTDPQPGQTLAYLDQMQSQIARQFRELAKFDYVGGTLFLYAP